MSQRGIVVRFIGPEVRLLLNLISDARESGEYYGNREQHSNRLTSVEKKLMSGYTKYLTEGEE